MDENKEYLDEVEEEVDESVEDEEDFTEDNEEFTDSADEDADDEEASEEEDNSETEDESEGNEDNDADSNADEESGEEEAEEKTNSYQAQKRREREAREERLKKDAYVKGMIEALGGENPYTGEKIEDSSDVEEYLMMRDLEKQGKDPVADFHKAVKQKAKDTATKAKEEQQRTQELQDFATKYPNVKMSELLANERFVKFAGKRVGNEALSDIYADYLSFTSDIENAAEEKQRAKSARKKASPGSLTGNGDSTKQSYETMSDKAFERKLAAVLRGTEKI
jgi:hypothetical protein